MVVDINADFLDKVITDRGRKIFPGLLNVLNTLCLRLYNVKCANLLITDPEKLLYIVVKHAGDITTAKIILRDLFIKPLLSAIDSAESPDALLNLIESSPHLLKEKVWQLSTVNTT